MLLNFFLFCFVLFLKLISVVLLNVWKELIDEADLNKDGEIDFEDFSKLMEEC